MGMPMANLHEPSVARSRTSDDTEEKVEDVPLMDLIQQKDRLEAELSALGSVLDSHSVNMSTTLTTFDGFPRADIDVAQIRTTRARIIHLRNDHKALMSRIEKGLHAHFASVQDQDTGNTPATSSALPTIASASTNTSTTTPSSSNTAPTRTNGTTTISTGPPFAIINSVTPGSPASAANLEVGDKIQKFGDADFFNHEKLSRVAQIVQRSEGRPVGVVVLRRRRRTEAQEDVSMGEDGEEQVSLELTPRRDWGGRGLLGCHLLPL